MGETAMGEQGWRRVRALASRHMWFEFVAGSLLCSERFFSWYPGFPLS